MTEFKHKLGIILSFNRYNLALRVALDGESKVLKTDSTIYDSGRPRCAPEVGTRVKVIYNHDGAPLAVRRCAS